MRTAIPARLARGVAAGLVLTVGVALVGCGADPVPTVTNAPPQAKSAPPPSKPPPGIGGRHTPK